MKKYTLEDIKKLDEYVVSKHVDEETREIMEFESENRDKINEIIDVVNQLLEEMKE